MTNQIAEKTSGIPRRKPLSIYRALLFVLFVGSSVLLGQAPTTPSASISAGKILYAEHCSGCHGVDARGGDRAPKLIGNRRLRSFSLDQLRNLIRHGIPAAGMPAFDLPLHQLEETVAFVHSLNTIAAENPPAGDIKIGEQLFFGEGRCASCHMINGRGGIIGPDLSSTGLELTVNELEEAILRPNERITPGYDLVTVTLRDRQTLRGFARGRTNFDLQLQDLHGEFHLLQHRDLLSIHDENQSAMKPWNATPAELQNMMAYLSRQTGIAPRTSPSPATNRYSSEATHVDFARIQNPRPGDWLTYNGQLSGNRYSTLDQINTGNVGKLAMQWLFPVDHFGLEATPLVADGIMYLTGANETFALDALTGRLIWKYSRPRTQGLVGDASLGTSRGVALLGDKIFVVTDNAHLLALNRITGHLMWEVTMPDEPQHYGSTVAPLIVKDTVIAGVSGGDWGIRGFIACYKASTGERIWRHWTIPAKGEAGSETWIGPEPLFGGGATWLTGSYDMETDTLYWPTGNPFPDSDDRGRGGDNLFTNCILAMNPDTGALKWHYQFTPHDVRDRDATEPAVLVDTNYQGQPRKLLLHADRNGFFYVLDRTNGQVLRANKFLHRVNWATGIDAKGRPQLSDARKFPANEDASCPNDAANWNATAFSPRTHLYYFMTLEQCEDTKAPDTITRTRKGNESGEKYLRAVDIDTGAVAWEIRQIGAVSMKNWPGVLATAGGVLFYGDPNGAFVAVEERQGKLLWHFPTNVAMKASPMTYMVNGKQFIAIAAGSNILCFGLGR